MSECTYELIHENIAFACEYVKENCESSYINLYALHYCTFEDNFFISIPLFIIILLICFFLLSDTSNRYLSPALTILSDKLNMSQNLAGVTFLALGNGAPDVISGIVASEDSGGIEFTVGSLTAAGVFVTCIVFSSVVLLADKVQLTRQLFLRDVLLYLITIVILMLFSLNGKINLWEAIGFFSLYIV
jgi:sodium/potassium/calcium exchanger 6